MPKGVYIGDIDPNNTVASVREVRRNILFKLLLWDSIVLSDSQFLTDPRIAMMMSSFNHKYIDPANRYPMDDWHGGFELLLNSGLVEVAHRTDAVGEMLSVEDVWTSMNKNSGAGRVPFLPRTSAYAEYLDQTAYHKRTYNLARISEIFKTNLQKGYGTALSVSPTDDTDLELGRMFREQTVLFREILQFIKTQLANGKITQARYDEIYKYVYGCYHINVPTVANCFVCTDYEKLPVHLELGSGVKEDKGGDVDQSKLRPTWALDPRILDLLPIGSFLKVRSAVQAHVDSGLLLKYNTGELTEDEKKEYQSCWESYTATLESALMEAFREHYEAIDDIVSSAYVPRQQRITNGTLEIVANMVVKPAISAAVPLAGTLFSAADHVRNAVGMLNTFIMVHRSGEPMDARAYKNEMRDLMFDFAFGHKAITYRIEK